jgi:hypothetical protein
MNLFRAKPDPTEVHKAITRVWENHDDEAHRASQSHIRGVGRWADDEKWQWIGRRTLGLLNQAYTRLARAFPYFPTVLEWGPGGGSIAYAFREFAKEYVGVDISARNLDAASRVMQGHPFTPILLTGAPGTMDVKGPIDIFISNAVFQHFPSKEYGAEVLRTVRAIAAPDAVGMVQIRYDNGSKRYRPITRLSQYYRRHITATSYELGEFWDLLIKTGWQPLCIPKIKTADQEGYFLFSAK